MRSLQARDSKTSLVERTATSSLRLVAKHPSEVHVMHDEKSSNVTYFVLKNDVHSFSPLYPLYPLRENN